MLQLVPLLSVHLAISLQTFATSICLCLRSDGVFPFIFQGNLEAEQAEARKQEKAERKKRQEEERKQAEEEAAVAKAGPFCKVLHMLCCVLLHHPCMPCSRALRLAK